MNTKTKLVLVILILTLFSIVIGQNIILYLSLGNIYTGLSSQDAKTLFEVKDLRAVAKQELTETRQAAEMTRADNAGQEAYTQKQIKTLSDYVTKQRQLEIKQTRALSESLVAIDGRFNDFGGQLQAFDDQLYRLKTQSVEQRQAVADSEESGYKYLYLVCLEATASKGTAAQVQAGCRETIRLFYSEKLHEQPAPGWVWPLETGTAG